MALWVTWLSGELHCTLKDIIFPQIQLLFVQVSLSSCCVSESLVSGDSLRKEIEWGLLEKRCSSKYLVLCLHCWRLNKQVWARQASLCHWTLPQALKFYFKNDSSTHCFSCVSMYCKPVSINWEVLIFKKKNSNACIVVWINPSLLSCWKQARDDVWVCGGQVHKSFLDDRTAAFGCLAMPALYST